MKIWALVGINGLVTGLLCTIIYCDLRWLKVMLSLILANVIAAAWSFVPVSARKLLLKQWTAMVIILLVLNLNEYEPIFHRCDTTTTTYREDNYLVKSPSTIQDLTTSPKAAIIKEHKVCRSYVFEAAVGKGESPGARAGSFGQKTDQLEEVIQRFHERFTALEGEVERMRTAVRRIESSGGTTRALVNQYGEILQGLDLLVDEFKLGKGTSTEQ
jgi:hypothetical protein